MPRLPLSNFAAVLERFAPRYEAIDVFADDVEEFAQARNMHIPPPGLALRSVDTSANLVRYGFRPNGTGPSYSVTLHPDRGIVRIGREQGTGLASGGAAVGAAAGALIGTAIATASDRKGEAWPIGLLLGLLVGASLGGAMAPGEQAPQRVFTLRFDAQAHNWLAYDGGLVPWMKDTMAVTQGR